MHQENYTVTELLAMLKEDDSWEQDPEKRTQLVESYKLFLSIWFC